MINHFLCPTCKMQLDSKNLCCPKGHCYSFDNNGVLCLLDEKVKEEFATFAAAVSQKRQEGNYPLSDPDIYDALPCAPALKKNKEWHWRCDDLSIVRDIIERHPDKALKRILDVGAYNGWLSHQLAKDGHEVTAVDYFTDEFDGLGAAKHYSHQFQPIQLDIADLEPLDLKFDVVIMNHGLHFFPDPAAQIRQLEGKVAPGGLLIIIGLIIYQYPMLRKRYMARAQQEHLQKYDRPLLFRPARGYLDHHDRNKMRNSGIILNNYPRFWFVNLLSRMIPILPWLGYGLKYA